jgi:hypothetical protein
VPAPGGCRNPSGENKYRDFHVSANLIEGYAPFTNLPEGELIKIKILDSRDHTPSLGGDADAPILQVAPWRTSVSTTSPNLPQAGSADAGSDCLVGQFGTVAEILDVFQEIARNP